MGDLLKVNKKARGNSGIVSNSGIYEEEYLDELKGVDQAIKFDKMRRSDTQVRKLRAAIHNPIKSANSEVQASPEDKEEKYKNLIEQILFKDMVGGWTQKLGEILTFLDNGHAVFEIVHENKENQEIGSYTGLKNLAFRGPKTLTEWIRDKDTGELLKIRQETTGDITSINTLLCEFLVIFYNEREGDDNGFSLLRPLYGPYKRKLLYLQLLAIGMERNAIGTPIASMPQETFDEDDDRAVIDQVMQDFTTHETSYILKPDSVSIEMHNNDFDPEKMDSSIKAEDERMAGAWLASFLELGTGGNGGAFALGNDLSDFFLSGIVYIAKEIEDVINNRLIPHLMLINHGPNIPRDQYPVFKITGIDDKAGKETADILSSFINSGIITKDLTLEDWVRKHFNFPKLSEEARKKIEEILKNSELEPTNPNDPKKTNSKDPKIEDEEEDDETKLSVKNQGLKFKNAGSQITANEKVVREIMQRNGKGISDKLINDVSKNYKNLSDNQKLKATKGVKAGKTAAYKKELKAALTDIAMQSMRQVQKEVPGFEDFKFKMSRESDEVLAIVKEQGLKFKDESSLPIHTKLMIDFQASQLVTKQAADLESSVFFSFSGSESSTNDIDVMVKDMADASESYLKGPSVVAGSGNVTATIVNDTRKAFFDTPEVLDTIQSFTFMNSDPKTEICNFLAGQTFEANDSRAWTYQTPLHHNCKTWIRANLKSSKNQPEITKGGINPPSSAVSTITLKDGCSCRGLLI